MLPTTFSSLPSAWLHAITSHMFPLLKLIGLTLLVAVVLALSAERYLSGQSSGWDVFSHILIACWLLYEVWQRFRENANGK